MTLLDLLTFIAISAVLCALFLVECLHSPPLSTLATDSSYLGSNTYCAAAARTEAPAGNAAATAATTTTSIKAATRGCATTAAAATATATRSTLR